MSDQSEATLAITVKDGREYYTAIAGPRFRGYYELLTDGTWRGLDGRIVSDEWVHGDNPELPAIDQEYL